MMDTITNNGGVTMGPFDWQMWARKVLGLLDSPEIIVCLPEAERFKLSCLFDEAREAMLPEKDGDA